MKFTISRALIMEAVMNVSRVIPAKSSIPALEGMQIKASDNLITLTGYDMESGITTTVEAAVNEPGEIVLSSRLFSEMVRKMSEGDISVTVGEKYLTEIKSGRTEFTILGTPSDEYPELPVISDGTGISIPQHILKSMIEQTLFAVATTDTKPVHTGSLFDIKGDAMTVVSVDGYRLALRNASIKDGGKKSFVVPGKLLSEIVKLLHDDKDKDKEKEEEAVLMISGRHIVFKIGNYSVVSRLLEGDFLDYKSSIPSGGSTIVRISTRGLIESIERASLLISDRLRSPLRIIFEQDKVFVSCSTSIGKFYDEVSCSAEGPSVEMGFNNKYLLDALKASSSDEVRIEIRGALSPIKILPPEGEEYSFLVLPVRLKNDA